VEPPRIARLLLERALPEDLRESVAGDVDEMFARRVERAEAWRARFWYWRQAFSFAGRFSVERLRGRVARAPWDAGRWRRSLAPVSLLDWKLGFRMVARYPWLSLVSGVALAVAIGFGAGFFHAIRLELFPRLGLEEGERIVRIELYDAAAARQRPTTIQDYQLWRDALTSVAELSAYRTLERNLSGSSVGGVPLMVAEVTPTAFALTRVTPLLGRHLTESDALPGAPAVVVLGYDVWATRLEGDPSVIGREVQLGRDRFLVIGVMPAGFGFPISHEAWVPLRATGVTASGREPPVQVFGRLAPGVRMKAAQAEMAAIVARTIVSEPPIRPRVMRFGAPDPSGDNLAGAILANLLVMAMLAAVSANVATLVFARTAVRESEIVVRSALGASRARIAGQLFIEALVLSSTSAVVGLLGARAVLAYIGNLQKAAHARIPYWWTPEFDLTTVLYTAGLAVIGAAFVALLPALKALGANVQHGLKNMGGGATNLGFGGIWTVIIVFQVAFTVLSLPFGVGYARDVWRSAQLRSGFPAERYLSFELAIDEDAGPAEMASGDIVHIYQELARRLTAEAGVDGVTFGSGLPGMRHRADALEREAAGTRFWPYHAFIDVDYFNVFDVPMVAGRGLRSGDVAAENRPVLVNESLARSLGPVAIGTRLRRPGAGDQDPGPWLEIVGVVRNLGTDVYDRDPTRGEETEVQIVYYPVAPGAVSRLFVGVKTREPAALAPRVRDIAARIDPSIRLYDALPLDVRIRRDDRAEVLAAWSGVGAVLLCIFLSAAGLFALMAVAVARRTREIGIRLALGAGRADLLTALFSRAARQLGTGIAAGLAAVLAVVFAFDSVRPQILPPMLAVAVFMTLVGFLACAGPARRALRIEPTEALRQQ
jgi:predicted permease